MEKLLADSIYIFHIGWMLALFIGCVAAISGLMRKRPRIATIWALGIAATSASTAAFGYCFLTVFEQRLRAADDPEYERTRAGFVWRVFEFFGIHLNDVQIFLLVNISFLIALLAAAIWHMTEKQLKPKISREVRILILTAALTLVAMFPWLHARGEGGGGFDCTGLVDINALVTEGYLGTIPNDPTGVGTNGTGYEISIDSNNVVTVSAPNAETRTIEISR